MKKILLISTISLSLLLTSCYTSRVYHGNMTEDTPQIKVLSKNNPILLWGLLPLAASKQQAKDVVRDRTDYTTQTSWTFVNGLLNFITLGIYSPTTTTYYLPISQYGNNTQVVQGYYQSQSIYQRQRNDLPSPPIQEYRGSDSPSTPMQEQYQQGFYPNPPVQQYQVPPIPKSQQQNSQNPPSRPSYRQNSQY